MFVVIFVKLRGAYIWSHDFISALHKLSCTTQLSLSLKSYSVSENTHQWADPQSLIREVRSSKRFKLKSHFRPKSRRTFTDVKVSHNEYVANAILIFSYLFVL